MDYNEKLLAKCLFIEVLIACIIGSATVLGVSNIVSPLFYFSFLVPLVYLYKYVREFPQDTAFLSLCCILNVSINGMIYGGNLDFNYYKKVIMFLIFMSLIYHCTDLKKCRKLLLDCIEILPVVVGGIFVIAYLYLGNTAVKGGGIVLGFPNPNTAGMWLFHLILYGVLFIFDSSKSILRFLYIPVIAVMITMLELTRTRSCYVALLFLAVMLLLGVFRIKVNKRLSLIILLLPLIYALIYVKVVDTSWVQTKFSFLISEGKTLNARLGVWNESIASIKNHFILGNYSGISNGTGQSQMHNTHIDVLTSYGAVPFFLFIKILFGSTTKTIDRANSFYKYASLCAFYAVLIMGAFEAAMVAGSMGLNLLTVGLLVLASADGLKKDEYMY